MTEHSTEEGRLTDAEKDYQALFDACLEWYEDEGLNVEEHVWPVVKRIIAERVAQAKAEGANCARCHGAFGWHGAHGIWEPCPDCDPGSRFRPAQPSERAGHG